MTFVLNKHEQEVLDKYAQAGFSVYRSEQLFRGLGLPDFFVSFAKLYRGRPSKHKKFRIWQGGGRTNGKTIFPYSGFWVECKSTKEPVCTGYTVKGKDGYPKMITTKSYTKNLFSANQIRRIKQLKQFGYHTIIEYNHLAETDPSFYF